MSNGMPPIYITFMIACYTTSNPIAALGDDHWNSPAGMDTRSWLIANNLIGTDYIATARGEAWIKFICQTPLPVCTWTLPPRCSSEPSP